MTHFDAPDAEVPPTASRPSATEPTQGAEDPGLGRSAGVLAIGNLAGRVLGLGREMVIAALFGASGQVSAFRVASQVAALLYDFLIGGMLSAALVPVLSETLRLRGRPDFARLVATLVGAGSVILAGVTLLLMLAAPLVTRLMAGGFFAADPELAQLTSGLIRLTAPAVWLLGMSGLFMAVLFALQRFTFPALAAAVFNLGVIAAGLLLAQRVGIAALAVGILVGSASQLVLIAWDVRRSHTPMRPRLDWRHPALGKIMRLYAPIALGLAVMLVQVGLDRRLASETGSQSIAWMAAATTLQQLPLGLISVAVSLAALPSLSQFFAVGDEAAFRATLGRGLRMVLLFIAPAAVGLWLLGEPIVRLLFQRGAFTPEDTARVASALDIYVIGMVFAAVDFPLNYAFYARNNTWLPTLVGIASMGVYAIVALALMTPLGFLGLVWADTAKQAAHAVTMVYFLRRALGGLDGQLGRGLTSIALACAVMACVILLVAWGLALPAASGALADLFVIAAAGGAGLLTYGATLLVMGHDEARQVWRRMAHRRIISG